MSSVCGRTETGLALNPASEKQTGGCGAGAGDGVGEGAQETQTSS